MPNEMTYCQPDFEPAELRRVLGDFATGVTVLARQGKNMPIGMTANAFTSVSLDPPLVLVSIAVGARILPRMARGSRFSINILAGDQEAIGRCYGSSKNQADVEHWSVANDLPVIKNAAAHLGCEVTARHKHGDHILIVSTVNWITRQPTYSVLTFHRGKFGTLGSERD